MDKKGVPKRDGSGKGIRKNMGRGGCTITQLNMYRNAERPPRRGWMEIRRR